MLEKLKSVLLEIRKSREDDLCRYKLLCGDDPERVEKRKSILTLELPYQTDTASMLHARSIAYQEKDGARNALLGMSSAIWYLTAEGDQALKPEKVPSKNAIKLINEWINSVGVGAARRRRTVWNKLKESDQIQCFFASPSNPDGKLENVPAGELPHILSRRRVEQIIDHLDVDDSAKTIYRSHANSLLEFLSTALPVTEVLAGHRSRLSANDAAKLFDFLETRALKGTTIRAYQDILLVRAMFYAPVTEKELFDLGLPNEQSRTLQSGDAYYRIPCSFISLRKALPQSDRLLGRQFDPRQLHKKIRRLGDYAGLGMSLTPSMLRRFAKSTLFAVLEIDGRTASSLPLR
jgi:hypothetical protein